MTKKLLSKTEESLEKNHVKNIKIFLKKKKKKGVIRIFLRNKKTK